MRGDSDKSVMRIILVCAMALIFGFQAKAAVPAPKELHCLTTREYVTTLEFLRDSKEFQLPEKDARALATRVSDGCTGAALRFIKVTRLLTKAGVGSKDAVTTAADFAHRTDAETA